MIRTVSSCHNQLVQLLIALSERSDHKAGVDGQRE